MQDPTRYSISDDVTPQSYAHAYLLILLHLNTELIKNMSPCPHMTQESHRHRQQTSCKSNPSKSLKHQETRRGCVLWWRCCITPDVQCIQAPPPPYLPPTHMLVVPDLPDTVNTLSTTTRRDGWGGGGSCITPRFTVCTLPPPPILSLYSSLQTPHMLGVLDLPDTIIAQALGVRIGVEGIYST